MSSKEVIIEELYQKLRAEESRLLQDLDSVRGLLAQAKSWAEAAEKLVENRRIRLSDTAQDISPRVLQQNANDTSSDATGTLTSRIIALLDASPERSFSPIEIAETLTVDSKDVNARTSYLVQKKRIRKIGRGTYQSILNSEENQNQMPLAG